MLYPWSRIHNTGERLPQSGAHSACKRHGNLVPWPVYVSTRTRLAVERRTGTWCLRKIPREQRRMMNSKIITRAFPVHNRAIFQSARSFKTSRSEVSFDPLSYCHDSLGSPSHARRSYDEGRVLRREGKRDITDINRS